MKNKLKKARQWAKEIKNKYPKVDYKVQLGLCLSALYQQDKGGIGMEEKELPKLEGSEKQIAWAISIRNNLIEGIKLAEDYFIPVAQERIEELKAKGKGYKVITETILFVNAQIRTIKDIILQENNASWYINNRYIQFNFPEESVVIFRNCCKNADDYPFVLRKKFVEELKEKFIALNFFALRTPNLEELEKNEVLNIKVESRVNKFYKNAKEKFALDLFNNKYKKEL